MLVRDQKELKRNYTCQYCFLLLSSSKNTAHKLFLAKYDILFVILYITSAYVNCTTFLVGITKGITFFKLAWKMERKMFNIGKVLNCRCMSQFDIVIEDSVAYVHEFPGL